MSRRPNPKKAEIISRRERGDGPRQIERDLGLSPSAVAGILFRAGLTDHTLPARGNAATPEFRRAVLDAANRISQVQAAREWGVSQPTISLWATGRA